MKTIDLTNNNYNLTEKEQKVLLAHFVIAEENCGMWGRELLYDNCSSALLEDFVKKTDYSTNQVKGILGSLMKKGIIWLDDRKHELPKGNPWVYYIYAEFIEKTL